MNTFGAQSLLISPVERVRIGRRPGSRPGGGWGGM